MRCLLIFIHLVFPVLLFAQKQPQAVVIPYQVHMHGEVITDDYAWMRQKESKGMLKYLKRENAYTDKMMKGSSKLQKDLYLEMLSRIPETDYSVPFEIDGYIYSVKTEKKQDYPIFYRTKIGEEAAQVILDVNQVVKDEKCYYATPFGISPNNNLMCVGILKANGIMNIKFKDLSTGNYLTDELKRVSAISWAADNKTLFYVTDDPVTNRSTRLYRYVLGSGEHELLYTENDVHFSLRVNKSRSGEYIFLTSFANDETEVWFIDASKPFDDFKIIAPREEGHFYRVEHAGDEFFIMTNKDALNFKVVRVPVDNVGLAQWKEFFPHNQTSQLTSVQAYHDFLLVSGIAAGINTLTMKFYESGKEDEVRIPGELLSVSSYRNLDFKARKIVFTAASPIHPETYYELDLATFEYKLVKNKEMGGSFNAENYTLEQTLAPASDGTLIPVTLVYRKGMDRNGKNPMLLEGYGAYGISDWHYFDHKIFSLVDRGVIYGIAHVRGGNEMGRQWYFDGRMLNKKNSFSDFIAVAEYLIAENYTSPDRIVATGASAGGLLMGAVLNQRPDLFHGVVLDVPFVDVLNTMLDSTLPLTTEEYKEWGSPYEKEYFDYIKSYCPYSNVKAQEYPNMLFISGFHDEQVGIWEPAKMVAKLRRLKTDDNLLLFRAHLKGGHGGNSGRSNRLMEKAFEYAFILKTLGLEEVSTLK